MKNLMPLLVEANRIAQLENVVELLLEYHQVRLETANGEWKLSPVCKECGK